MVIFRWNLKFLEEIKEGKVDLVTKEETIQIIKMMIISLIDKVI
jgi:hypothetical protein